MAHIMTEAAPFMQAMLKASESDGSVHLEHKSQGK